MEQASEQAMSSGTPKLELRGISKRYPDGTPAVQAADLRLRHGTIHAVIGENGAGKSTLLKMLYGLEQPSAGEIRLDGKPVVLRNPRDAINAGIGLVPQHVALVPSFTAAQNVVLGREPGNGAWLDLRRAEADVAALAQRFGLDIDPRRRADDMPAGMRQRVEILKTLYRGARLLLLDEPTAVLTPQETDDMFSALRRLVDEGLSIVLITHKVAEMRMVCDHYTVLRGGVVSAHGDMGDASDADIAALMTGRDFAPLQVVHAPHREVGDAPLLSVQALCAVRDDGKRELDGISFNIAAGEILGIAGVADNGQDALADILCGLRPPAQGTATLAGQSYCRPGVAGVRAAREAGVAAIPEDRLQGGIAATMSIADNVIALDYHKAPQSRFGWLAVDAAWRKAAALIEGFGVVASSVQQAAGSLSGGNMQKVLMARELASAPRFLIASQPTRGVDIGAAQLLRRQLLALRERGCAILLISSDLDEILQLSDRIAVLYRGRITARFDAGATDAATLGFHMAGATHEEAAP